MREDVLESMTNMELETLARDVATVLDRRRVEERARELNVTALTNVDVHRGEAWAQPPSSVGAYPLGWEVEHDGRRWVSLVEGNVWEPGVTGWREVTDDAPPEWIQPLGAHDAYDEGAQVAHDGQVFESLVPWNVWHPTGAQWRLVPSDDDSQDDDGDGEGEDPGVLAWAPGQDVTAGDLRTHDGIVYRALQSHRTQDGWEPPAVPALWTPQENTP